MAELVVKNVAFNYSPVEDRVLLKCMVSESLHELWLTQRMLLQLLPELMKWLSRCGLNTTQTKEFMRSSLLQRSSSGEKANYDKKVSQGDLVSRARAAGSASPKEADQSAQEGVSDKYVWLCTKANLVLRDQRLRMKLESEFADDIFIFSMTSLEASHFLIVLRDSLKNSDWLCQWPEWLPLVEEECLPKDTYFLH